jgi:tagatose 1,6-diphosphate aldolase
MGETPQSPFRHLPLARRLPAGDGVSLALERTWTPAQSDWSAPAYVFGIMVGRARAGRVSLRIGDTPELRLFTGHIGYSVDEAYRGRRLALRASRLVLPLAAAHAIDPVWITCHPGNTPSIRTIEALGATYVETVDLPEGHPAWLAGERQKRRYRLRVVALSSSPSGEGG